MPYLERHEEITSPAAEYRPETPAFQIFFNNWCRKNRSPLHAMFADDISNISDPDSKRQFVDSVFHRGREMLLHNMPAAASPERTEGQTLYEVIQPERLGAELESMRATGNIAAVSSQEREIVDVIQGEVGKIDRKTHLYLPADMLSGKSICCVGASLIGGALMERAKINYLVSDVPEHSFLFLLTSDGHVAWRDMFQPANNEDITNDMISGTNQEGSPLTTADIIAFSKKPHSRGLMFEMPGSKYRQKLPWIKDGERQSITLLAPGYGQEVQVLGNLALLLHIKGCFSKIPEERRDLLKQAVETYHFALAGDPQLPNLYSGLGNTLNELGSFGLAAEAHKKSIDIDPDCLMGYKGLVDSCCSLGRAEEARAASLELKKRASGVKRFRNTFLCQQAESRIAQLEEERRVIN